ncbi:MAG TPA: primosomal protein N' [Bacteroidota bacterium]|jgi:primosomal protein N' (replication factor Y)|nr:primosomal protein N' [Bacteroidota bacterium]
MHQLFADLAIPASVDKLFTYSVPAELSPAAQPGVRALIPFGNRKVVGMIVARHTVTPRHPRIKAIEDILDNSPLLTPGMLSLARWIAEYYFAPLGDVLKAVLPQQALRPAKRIVKIVEQNVDPAFADLSKHQRKILELLRSSKRISVPQLQKKLGGKQLYSTLHTLENGGYIEIRDEAQAGVAPKYERFIVATDHYRYRWRAWLESPLAANGRNEPQKKLLEYLISQPEPELRIIRIAEESGVSASTLRTLERKELIESVLREKIRMETYDLYPSALGATDIILNEYQHSALGKITEAMQAGTFRAFLLYGVTGSGKTQVYIDAIRRALDDGKTAIVLIPEISLTPQIVRRFKYHFGDQIVAIHSRLSTGERYDAWRLIRGGKCRVVIGPRSAIFAPLQNIGLIVVDEEQESSYKQFDQSPRYHARDVAIVRAKNAGAAVVLGSATPSLESYANAQAGKYTLLELPERVDDAKLPRIEIVDMLGERQTRFAAYRAQRKEEFKKDREAAKASGATFSFDMISEKLKDHIAQRLERKEGIILLQNRRGFAPVVECGECGYVEMCGNCNITLTYHLTQKHLRCHYCGFMKQPPEQCPNCKGPDVHFRGFGTERVEEEIRKLFPSARLLRMDLDTTSRKGSHDRILKTFSEGEADILLGTQMVGKGLDFPRVTLVGVISADVQMLLPDFRSSERTFQLLTQVSGRAGRSALAGEVIVQTFQPNHYTLRHVLGHNFRSFYDEEITHRRELLYPPFSRLVLIECKGERENAVREHIAALAGLLPKNGAGMVLGPSPAAIPRINGQFRWHIVLKDSKSKDPSGELLHRTVRKAIEAYHALPLGKRKEVRWIVDVDPVGMM